MKIPFGYSVQDLDVSEYRQGTAASVRDGYRLTVGQEEHFRKRPGLTSFTTGLQGPVQGFYDSIGGGVYCVAGGKVYSLASSGTATLLSSSTMNTTNPVTWAEDFDYIYAANGGRIFQIKLSTGAVGILELGGQPNNATHIVHAKGYILTNGSLSGSVTGDVAYATDSTGKYTSWSVFNNEQVPDSCNGLISGWDGEVYAFGPKSVEVSYNDGVTPWALLEGATMQYGLLAPYTLLIADNTIFWLTEADGARHFVKMVNREPVIIDSPYTRVINEMSTVSDARSWLQSIHGKVFYMTNFPTVDKTFAYKMDDGTWSEFHYYNNGSYERYLGRCGLYVSSWNKYLVGDRKTGTIYYQDGTSDNGDVIRCELTSGMVDHGTNKRKRERTLYHRVKRGYAAGGTFGFRIRNDNGQWQNEKSLDLGSLGSTKPYIRKPSGGVFRARQYQYIHTDTSSDFIFMGLDADVEPVE